MAGSASRIISKQEYDHAMDQLSKKLRLASNAGKLNAAKNFTIVIPARKDHAASSMVVSFT